MKRLALFALVAVGAVVGLRKARLPATESNEWSRATDSVPD